MDMTSATEKMEYNQLTEEIKKTMRRSAKDAVRLGFMLRRVMEERIWEAVHDCFDDYLREELHMEYSMACRFMAINKKYSLHGKSMDISPEYEGYSQGALIEMLSMPEELEGRVKPEMTVREVREMKRQAKKAKQPLEAEKVTGQETDIPGQMRAEDYPEMLPDAPKPEKEMVIDGECREVPREPELEIATSQPERVDGPHDEHWFVRQFVQICPGEAEGLREVCGMEEKASCRAKAVQEYISPYGGCSSSCAEWSFEFHGFAKGVDIRVGTEEMHFTYARFTKTLMEVAAEKENADGPNREAEKLSAYGLPVTEYPEGSLLTGEGCGHKYDCFSCAQDCGIRQKERYCREAPLGNPFGCATMGRLGQIREEMGDACQFICQEKAYHMAGSGEASPCCKECNEDCGYRCSRSAGPQDREEDTPETELAMAKRLLSEAGKLLDDYIKVGGLPEATVLRQKIIVTALESLVSNLEKEELGQEEAWQPELPPLKNNNQRKEWLENYKAWGLWYRDENIDVNYYKYDFQDGSRLVVAEYPQRQEYWCKDAKDEHYFHLLEKGKKGYGKIRYDEKYRHTSDGETYLVEFLKGLQKKG